MIKLDIINEVVNRTGITKTKAEMAVETVFESMKRALGKGERIELRGFGIFNVRPRKTGIGRNPRTGAEVAIPPGKAVRFKPGKELQTLAVSTAACPPTATLRCRPHRVPSRAVCSTCRRECARVPITAIGCTRCCCWQPCSPPRWWVPASRRVSIGIAPFDFDLNGYVTAVA